MDHADIQATIEANNAAVVAGDMDAVLATFEPQGTLVGQPGMTATGTSALREAFGQFMGMAPSIVVTDHDIVQSGDIAIHASTWTMSAKAPDGSAIEQAGFSTVVLRKQSDGRWLIVIDNPFGAHLLNKG